MGSSGETEIFLKNNFAVNTDQFFVMRFILKNQIISIILILNSFIYEQVINKFNSGFIK